MDNFSAYTTKYLQKAAKNWRKVGCIDLAIEIEAEIALRLR